MSFFKKYNGTTHKGLARLETVIWTLIYGGLLATVVGFFMGRLAEDDGDILMVLGGIVSFIGLVLIVVRSRLREDH